MAVAQGTREPWRWIVGYPYRWQGIGMTALGLIWLVLALTEDPAPWRWIVAVAWIVLGVVLLLVATTDRRHGRGRYGRVTSGGGSGRPSDSATS